MTKLRVAVKSISMVLLLSLVLGCGSEPAPLPAPETPAAEENKHIET